MARAAALSPVPRQVRQNDEDYDWSNEIAKLPMPLLLGRFDIVFTNKTMHHVPDWWLALDEIKRVAAPPGFPSFRFAARHVEEDARTLTHEITSQGPGGGSTVITLAWWLQLYLIHVPNRNMHTGGTQ
jgi:SAM-dependent methyltransferase